ncbi:oxidoreductase NAD-binding domain-containing protein 1-like isoform X1 [Lytechinus variegatus]|uniref:oxidoreductase NAD-binding domain-containing protein 1-like isoform X1 n=1 Tax=Lytechinus variegatus TaxID=7654 RepID=UPI001BB1C4FC|nr:oxidoreductase NAD-binding domain-containing protein 1-like isoform X1 [Lytechinus variegatus]
MILSTTFRCMQSAAPLHNFTIGTFSGLCSVAVRTMSDHMDKTAQSFREPGISEAEVVSIDQASETVKVLKLKVDDPSFTFKAGQWVDFFVEGLDIFTGYSMYSGPTQLKEDSTIDLAVKFSDYPPTVWVHNQCAVGSKVKVRTGGDKLVFDPKPGDPSWNVLLIGGGIGINPLISLMHHAADLHDQKKANPQGYTPGKMELLFSASTKNELIFKDTIDELISKHSPDIAARFYVTKDSDVDSPISNRRIDASDIKSSVERLRDGPLRCFVCGPPTMIADMEGLLSNEGIPASDIFCEKWW